MNDMYTNDYYNYSNYCGDLMQKGQNLYYEPNYLDFDRSSSSCSECSSSSFDRVDSFFNPIEGFAKGNMQTNIYKPYKLTNPSMPPVYNERQRLLMEVQKYGFAMWDLNLYLNTHPTDRNVMMLFDQYRNAYKKAKQDYEERYGTLSLENTTANSGYWVWNKSPWPWEGE